MTSSLPRRIIDVLEDEFGAPTPGWAEHELHTAVAKLIGRVGELCALRELQQHSGQAFDRLRAPHAERVN